MVPKISFEELQRMFQSPVQSIKPLDTAQTVDLIGALEDRQATAQKTKFDQEQAIAEVERKIAEKQRQLGLEKEFVQSPTQETAAALEPRFAAQRLLTPKEPKPTKFTSAGEVIQDGKRFFMYVDSTNPRNRQLIPAGDPKQKGTAQGIIQRTLGQKENLSSLVDEFEMFQKNLGEAGFTGLKGVAKGKIAVPLDKLTGGGLQLATKGLPIIGNFLKVNPQISTQEELADSLGRRIYKTISGDVGNIAFSEGAFAVAFVPRAGETEQRRRAKIDRLNRFSERMETGVKELQKQLQNGVISEEEFKEAYGQLANQAFTDVGGAVDAQQTPGGGELSPEEQAELEALRAELGG